jgi:hypothetical protein
MGNPAGKAWSLLVLLGIALLSACHAANGISAIPDFSKSSGGSIGDAPQIFAAVHFLRPGRDVERLLVFGANANGNAAPLSDRPFRGATVLRGVGNGDYWAVRAPYANRVSLYRMDGTLVASTTLAKASCCALQGPLTMDAKRNFYVVWGPFLPGLRCMFAGGDVYVYEYRAGAGQRQPSRILDIGKRCEVPAIAVSADGTLYVAEQDNTGAALVRSKIEVYASNARGRALPQRTIRMRGGSRGISQLAAAGAHLFVNFDDGLFDLPNQDLSWKHPLVANAASFDVDASGTLYVLTSIPSKRNGMLPAIEVFERGATSPVRTLTGPMTKLGNSQSDSYLDKLVVAK